MLMTINGRISATGAASTSPSAGMSIDAIHCFLGLQNCYILSVIIVSFDILW